MVQFPESDKYSLPLRLNLLQWPLFCFHQKMRLSKGNLNGVTNSKTIKCLFIRPIIHIIFISIVLSFACSMFNLQCSSLATKIFTPLLVNTRTNRGYQCSAVNLGASTNTNTTVILSAHCPPPR